MESVAQARTYCFSYLKKLVTKIHIKELLRLITMDEVSTAVKELPTRKAPGVDSISAEFYLSMWEEIEFDVFKWAYNGALKLDQI